MKSLTFVIDACKVLAQARKVRLPQSSSEAPPLLAGTLTVPCTLPAGVGLLLRLQLLQPGDGEDGRDGAAD